MTDAPKRRGRPPKLGGAMTPAQKQAAYRARKKAASTRSGNSESVTKIIRRYRAALVELRHASEHSRSDFHWTGYARGLAYALAALGFDLERVTDLIAFARMSRLRPPARVADFARYCG